MEFLFIVALVIIVSIIFLIVVSDELEKLYMKKEYLATKDLTYSLQAELYMAASAGHGYRRSFSIEPEVGDYNFSILILGNNLIVRSERYEHTMMIPTVLGNLSIGTNLISNNDGVVCIGTTDCGIEDTVLPEVESTNPHNYQINVPVSANIMVYFSEKMNSSETESAFSSNPVLSGFLSWNIMGNELTFNPDDLINSNTTYYFTISTAAEDMAGNNMLSEYSFQFLTETLVEVDNPPAVSLVAPTGNYFSSGEVNFTFIPSDDNGLSNCSLYINSSAWHLNQSVIPVNGTVNNFIIGYLQNGSYTWSVECFDTAAQSTFASNVTFNLNPEYVDDPPHVTLSAPDDTINDVSGNINFSYIPYDNTSLANCSLYINNTAWQREATNLTPTNNSNNYFSVQLSQAEYTWNVECYDSADQSTFATANYTFYLNTTEYDLPAMVTLNYPNGITINNSDGNVTFNYTAYDNTSLANCSLYINNTAWQREATNLTPTNNSNNYFSIQLNDSEYAWSVECYDNSGNSVFATANYTFLVEKYVPAPCTFGTFCMQWSENTSVHSYWDTRFWVDDDTTEDEYVTAFANRGTIYVRIEADSNLDTSKSIIQIRDVNQDYLVRKRNVAWNEINIGGGRSYYEQDITATSSFDNKRSWLRIELTDANDDWFRTYLNITFGSPATDDNFHSYYSGPGCLGGNEWNYDYIIAGDLYSLYIKATGMTTAEADVRIGWNDYDFQLNRTTQTVTIGSGEFCSDIFAPSSGSGSDQWIALYIQAEEKGGNDYYRSANQFWINDNPP